MKKFKTLLTVMSLGFLLACSNESLDPMYETPKPILGDNQFLITLDQAKEELNGIMGEIRNSSTRSGDTIERHIAHSYPVKFPYTDTKLQQTDSLLTYVINFEDNNGFAIMSGDNRVPSLLAYVTEGNLASTDTITDPGLACFLTSLSPYIGDIISTEKFKWAIDISTPNISGNGYYVYGEWINRPYPETSLCPVKWGQREPYNLCCPIIDGNRTLTGCTATAVAQLMAVYKYPSSYNGYSFDWNQMTSYPWASLCSNVGKNQIARLMQQLGLPFNLNTSYGTDESGAYAENIPRTLSSFGYSSSGVIKNYLTENVVEEIKSNHPTLVSGYSYKKEIKLFGWTIISRYTGGHVWLIPGALRRMRTVSWYTDNGAFISSREETQWYVLCNWGWDGRYDGYYLSGVFDIYGSHLPGEAVNSDNEEDNTRSGSEGYFQYRLKTITGIRK